MHKFDLRVFGKFLQPTLLLRLSFKITVMRCPLYAKSIAFGNGECSFLHRESNRNLTKKEHVEPC